MIAALRELVAGRIRRARVMLARTMPGPLLVRLTVAMSALVALTLPYPVRVLTQPTNLAGLVLVALLPAIWPYTRIVSLVILGAAFGWVAGTAFFGEQVTVWRITAMAGALYLTHTTAALAAVLPYDTVVSPGVLAGWLLRAGIVIAATAGFAFLMTAGAERIGDRSTVVAAVVGVAVVVPLGWLLARWARRA
jgi:hypothetical protein